MKSTEEGNITGARNVRLLGILNEQWLTKGAVAPPKHQKLLSYTVGYLCVLGWHASLAGTCYAAGQQVQAIIVLANPNYTIHTWQTALLAWAVVIISIFFNTVMFRKLPMLEGIAIFAHVIGFCAFIVVLWYVRCVKVYIIEARRGYWLTLALLGSWLRKATHLY